MTQNRCVKILEVSSYPPPYAGWGVRVQFVKRRLEELGHDCQVLNIGKSRRMKSSEFVGVDGGLDYVLKVARFCREGFLIHMHLNGQSNKGILLTILAQVISLLHGRRCVLTFHAGSEQRFFPRYKSRLMIPVLYSIFLLSKKIICNDGIVKEKIGEYGIDQAKIHAIPAFSSQYMDSKPTDLPESLKHFMERSNPLLACYLLLRPTFDIKTLFHAVKELSQRWLDLGLVLMGSNTTPEDIDPKEVTGMVERLGLEKNLYWTGDLPHDKFLTVLSKSDVFVRTYIYDGVSSSVWEALVFNLPVVACENPHRPPGVLQYKTGDKADLVKKLETVLKNSQRRAESPAALKVEDTVSKEAKLLVEIAFG